MLVLSFILLLIIMIAPGNSKRKIAEISYYYEEFLNYNLVQKIFLCFNQFSFFYLNKRMLFFIVILLFALVIYNISKNSKWYVYLSIGLYFVGYFILINTNLFNLELIKNNITTLSGKTFIQFIASLFLILGLLFIIYLSFRKNKSLESLIGIISIPFIGICTKLIMGFSPTVFASSTRTSLFLYFSIIILIGVVIKETNLKNSNSFILLKFVFSIIISLFAIYGMIINFSLFC